MIEVSPASVLQLTIRQFLVPSPDPDSLARSLLAPLYPSIKIQLNPSFAQQQRIDFLSIVVPLMDASLDPKAPHSLLLEQFYASPPESPLFYGYPEQREKQSVFPAFQLRGVAYNERESMEKALAESKLPVDAITVDSNQVVEATSRVLELLMRAVKEMKDGSISFSSVSFRYSSGRGESTLSDISFDIRSGMTVGLVGGTGSGKSTLVQLIPRLYDVESGSVSVGGVDVRRYDLPTLRQNVSMVLQKNLLFSGSIRENMRWGKKDASDDEIWAALKAAAADGFVRAFPDGLDHDLGQGGVNVSGGQKQRLTIARALLSSPRVLILDDSTSAVDSATERAIHESLKALEGVTKIIIAERISSVRYADMIIVLSDGKVESVGTHEDLMASSRIYQEIYQSQMKGGRNA